MSQLAALGGTPVRDAPLPGGPHIDNSELAAVRSVLDSGLLSGFIGTPGDHFFGGPAVRQLESDWRLLGGYKHVVAVNSATSALHAGLVGLDLPRGSEVIVPPLTMSATIAAVYMAGLVPRFADIDEQLFTLTEDTVRAAITDRSAAILVVHLFGQMAPMHGLRTFAESKGLLVLEDAAQAPGASQQGVSPGTGTHGAIFSFNQNKVITCGEGGLLCSNNDTVAARAQLLRNHAESTVAQFPEIDPVGFIGWNYRLPELEAAVATAQTAKLGALTNQRIELAEHLTKRITDIPGLTPPHVASDNRHVYFTFALRFAAQEWGVSKDRFVRALHAEGVPAADGYVEPLYRLPMFDPDQSRAPENFPVSERLAFEELVLLPVCRYPLSIEDLDDVADAIEKCWDNRAELQHV